MIIGGHNTGHQHLDAFNRYYVPEIRNGISQVNLPALSED